MSACVHASSVRSRAVSQSRNAVALRNSAFARVRVPSLVGATGGVTIERVVRQRDLSPGDQRQERDRRSWSASGCHP
jgi:hypothetical protein